MIQSAASASVYGLLQADRSRAIRYDMNGWTDKQMDIWRFMSSSPGPLLAFDGVEFVFSYHDRHVLVQYDDVFLCL
jgi:hypothetical protein